MGHEFAAVVNLPSRKTYRAGKSTNRQMTADDIDQLRELAKWHERQARYLLLTVADGQHDGGRFHNAAAARLLRLVSQIEQKKLPAPLPGPGRQSLAPKSKSLA
jgi:hypothetical protein